MLWHGDSIINPAIYQLLVVQAIFFNHTPRPEPFFTYTPRPEPVEGRSAGLKERQQTQQAKSSAFTHLRTAPPNLLRQAQHEVPS
jgi:hypothetical protein